MRKAAGLTEHERAAEQVGQTGAERVLPRVVGASSAIGLKQPGRNCGARRSRPVLALRAHDPALKSSPASKTRKVAKMAERCQNNTCRQKGRKAPKQTCWEMDVMQMEEEDRERKRAAIRARIAATKEKDEGGEAETERKR